jgi:hypothetical protein
MQTVVARYVVPISSAVHFSSSLESIAKLTYDDVVVYIPTGYTAQDNYEVWVPENMAQEIFANS